MKKSSKTITAIIGTATLAIGLMAFPALAQTTRQQGGAWFGQMNGFMNSIEMQNLHNSQEMQNVMQAGDVQKMQELMNSDPAVKAHMGQENLDRMNEFMRNSGARMMSNGSGMAGSQGTMMNGGNRNTMASEFNF